MVHAISREALTVQSRHPAKSLTLLPLHRTRKIKRDAPTQWGVARVKLYILTFSTKQIDFFLNNV